MTLRSKIIGTPLQNNSHSTPFLERSVNYFESFGAEYHLLKLECSESSFTKHRGCQCNLPKKDYFSSSADGTIRWKKGHEAIIDETIDIQKRKEKLYHKEEHSRNQFPIPNHYIGFLGSDHLGMFVCTTASSEGKEERSQQLDRKEAFHE